MSEGLLFAPAPPSRLVRVMTWSSVIALVGGLVAVQVAAVHDPRAWWTLALVVGIVGGTFAGCWAYVPKGYLLTDEAVVILRQWVKPVVIPLAALRDARPISLPQRAVRLCGNGGLFMFAGLFSSKELGRFYMSARDLKRLVLLEGETIRSWVIAPEEVERFVEEVGQRLRRGQ